MKRCIADLRHAAIVIVFFACTFHSHATNKDSVALCNLPLLYRQPVQYALQFFPELKNARMQFRIRHAYTPLSTKPALRSIFRKGSRRLYIITISNSSIPALSPILFHQLTAEAQAGVIGHELSHVADFRSRNFFSLLATGIGHLSSRRTDRFEYLTDSICISHGLGKELQAWSVFVRRALHVTYWRGADNIRCKNIMRERYMNPDTIERFNRKYTVLPK